MLRGSILSSLFYLYFIFVHVNNKVFSTCSRTSLGWFAHQPEWYDVNIPNFCQSEALSVSVFVHFLSSELSDSSQSDSKGKPHESGNLIDVVQ